MASTTLVTFLFQSLRYVSRVELFGSWDNFAKPYPMQRDKAVSSRSWKGCHSFSEIVCDGDIEAMDGSTREGGLRMGGTYWYYYRLDDEVECHDPRVHSTRSCPFLPGQEVNVLEVPIQKDCVTVGSATPLRDVFTMDPAARFVSPKRLQSPCLASTTSHKSSVLPTTSSVQRTSSLRHSLLSNIPKFSLARSGSLPNRRYSTAISVNKFGARHEQIRPFSENDVAGLRDDWSAYANSILDDQLSLNEVASETFFYADNPQINSEASYDPENFITEIPETNLNNAIPVPAGCVSTEDAQEELQPYITQDSGISVVGGEDPTLTSDRTSGFFSLLSDSIIGSPFATNRHSFFHAQPQTPSLDIDGFTLEPFQLDFGNMDSTITKNLTNPAPAQLESCSQPAKECASTITLQQSATPFRDLNHTAKLSPLEKLDMVESWRHGESPSTVTEHEPSALQDLINDLGYLSSLID